MSRETWKRIKAAAEGEADRRMEAGEYFHCFMYCQGAARALERMGVTHRTSETMATYLWRRCGAYVGFTWTKLRTACKDLGAP